MTNVSGSNLKRRSKAAKLNIGPELDVAFTLCALCEGAEREELDLLAQALDKGLDVAKGLREEIEGRLSRSEVLARAIQARAETWQDKYPELHARLESYLKEEWEARRKKEVREYGRRKESEDV